MEGITCSSFRLSGSSLTWHHDAKFLDKTSALAVMAVGTSLLDVLSRKLCVPAAAGWAGELSQKPWGGEPAGMPRCSMFVRWCLWAPEPWALLSSAFSCAPSQNWELLGDLRVQILRTGKNWKAASLLGVLSSRQRAALLKTRTASLGE